jgi:hypothetical protein
MRCVGESGKPEKEEARPSARSATSRPSPRRTAPGHSLQLEFQKESPAAVPDFRFPRLHLRANLGHQKNGEAWQDSGHKVALVPKIDGVADVTQLV